MIPPGLTIKSGLGRGRVAGAGMSSDWQNGELLRYKYPDRFVVRPENSRAVVSLFCPSQLKSQPSWLRSVSLENRVPIRFAAGPWNLNMRGFKNSAVSFEAEQRPPFAVKSYTYRSGRGQAMAL